MHFISMLAGAFFLFGLIEAIRGRRGLVGAVTGLGARGGTVTLRRPDGPVVLPRRFPYRDHVARIWRNRRHERTQGSGEAFSTIQSDPLRIEIRLPVPRILHGLDLNHGLEQQLELTDVVFEGPDGKVEPRLAGRIRVKDGRRHIEIELDGDHRVGLITLHVTAPQDEFEAGYRLSFLAGDPDWDLLQEASAAQAAGRDDEAVAALLEYERYTKTNPKVCAQMAELAAAAGNWETAEAYGLRLCVLGHAEQGRHIYEVSHDKVDAHLPREKLGQLKAEAAEWELPGSHGLVALLYEHRYDAGFEDWHRCRFRHALLIRRRAAARRFRSLSYSWDGGRAVMMWTALRIVRADGTVEQVPQDRYTRGNAEDDNLFITVDRREAGHWILPDLEVGDVVEAAWDLMERSRGGREGFFLLESLTDLGTPTLRGEVELTWPGDWDLELVVRNADGADLVRNPPEDGVASARCVVRRHHPRIVGGVPYQGNVRNPVFAAGRAGRDWSEVAREQMVNEPALHRDDATLPAELEAVVAAQPDPASALAQAFYWVRDRIKYGSLASVRGRVGDEDRAEALVGARIGDCQDKTFLLALVCRRLGVPWQQVLVSSRGGLIVPELPADQFDHVFLRARLDERWLHLDAANQGHTFGNVPVGLQGLHGLVLGDGGELIEIPEDRMEDNRMEVRERLSLGGDPWLTSDVEITVRGTLARALDEHLKFRSLTDEKEQRAFENGLRAVLPGISIEQGERLAGTGDGDVCRVRVRGRRARLTELDGHRVAMCEISVLSLPVDTYRGQELGETFAFPARQTFAWTIELAADAAAVFQGFSRLAGASYPYGGLRQDLAAVNAADGLGEPARAPSMGRELVLSRRLVEGDGVATLPAFFEDVEDFSRVVLMFA